jgi:periplasmic protein TonB
LVCKSICCQCVKKYPRLPAQKIKIICGIEIPQHLIGNGAGFESFFLTSKPSKMNTETILKSDVLDILFDKRNKLYGAYMLRKFYPDRIKKSLAMMLGLVVVFCVFALIPRQISNGIAYTVVEGPTLVNVLPESKKPAPKPTAVTVSKSNFNANKFLDVISIVPDKDSADILNNDLEKFNPGAVTATGNADDPPFDVSESSYPGSPFAPVAKDEPMPDPAIPVENPEVESTYPGGMNALRDFLQRNLINPRDLEEDEQVSVKIKFIVGYDGTLKRFETVQDGGDDFNKEVIRVLKKMPQWLPGKSRGKNVSVWFTIPVKFVSKD